MDSNKNHNQIQIKLECQSYFLWVPIRTSSHRNRNQRVHRYVFIEPEPILVVRIGSIDERTLPYAEIQSDL